jgi:putative membrane protein
MKTWLSVAAIVCATTAWPAAAGRAQEDGPTAGGSATFIKTAAMAGMAEVELGKLAALKAESGDVKQFAQRLVDDHGKANNELKSLASRKHITLPSEPDAKHKAMQDELSRLDGSAFDRAYIMHMVAAHRDAIALFQHEANSVTDKETRAFAEKTLPTLEEHFTIAQDLDATYRTR